MTTVTAKLPDYVETHQDAQDLIKSLAPGCDVVFWRIKDTASMVGYQITVHRMGRQLFSPANAYALPLNVGVISKSIRETLVKSFGC